MTRHETAAEAHERLMLYTEFWDIFCPLFPRRGNGTRVFGNHRTLRGAHKGREVRLPI